MHSFLPSFILSRLCVRPVPPKSRWSNGETNTRTTHHRIRHLVLMNVVQECACGSKQGGLQRGDSFEWTPLTGSEILSMRTWALGRPERNSSRARPLPSASTHSWPPAPSASSVWSQLTGEFPYPQACVCYQLGGKVITP